MKSTLVAALVLFLSAAPLRPIWGQEMPEAGDKSADHNLPALLSEAEVPGIENLSLLEDSTSFAGALVGFGGATNPDALPWLRDAGFRTVINLRLSTEEGANVDSSRSAAAAINLRYIHLPFSAADAEPAIIDKFMAAVSEETDQPVFIHCGSATRVAALWMIARMLRDGWEIESAAEEARAIAGKPDAAIALAEKYLAEHELDH